jgi:hypothetical protein
VQLFLFFADYCDNDGETPYPVYFINIGVNRESLSTKRFGLQIDYSIEFTEAREKMRLRPLVNNCNQNTNCVCGNAA